MDDLGSTGERGRKPDEGDALAVLGWGLRHYVWIIVLSVLTLGIAVPVLVERTPETYEAEAQVGPSAELNLQNIDPLPRLGESLFRNGSVAEAVRQSFDPPLRPSEDVIPRRVRLVTAQDNVVLTVVGTASSAEAAAGLANVAAETLAEQLSVYDESVGSFTIHRRAEPPGRPVTRIGPVAATGFGALGGLAVGLGIVGLLLVRRRPVLTLDGAEAATGALVLGQVWLGRTSADARGLPQLCHTISTFGCEELLLVGRPKTLGARQELARLLSEVLGGRRDVTTINGLTRDHSGTHAPARVSGDGPRIRMAEDASQSQLVNRSDRSVAVLVVPHGVSRASLVRQVQQYLDGGASGILLVRDTRRRRLRRASTVPTPSEPAPPRTPFGSGEASSGNGSSPRTTPAGSKPKGAGG